MDEIKKQPDHQMPWYVVSADRKMLAKGCGSEDEANRDCEKRNERAQRLGTTTYIVIPNPN